MKLSFKKTAQGVDVMISSQHATLHSLGPFETDYLITLSFEAWPSYKGAHRRRGKLKSAFETTDGRQRYRVSVAN